MPAIHSHTLRAGRVNLPLTITRAAKLAVNKTNKPKKAVRLCSITMVTIFAMPAKMAKIRQIFCCLVISF